MDDLISRQAAIEKISETIWDTAVVNDVKTTLKELPSAQSDLIIDIQNGIKATNSNDAYSCGMRNGMRWCISLIDGKKPLYENCPSAQPERKKGKWINRSLNILYPEWARYTCSVCGEHSNRYDYCPNCGADMRGEQDE